MLADSSPGSAPNTLETRARVPGEACSRDPARRAPSSSRSTASSRLPAGGVAIAAARPRSAGVPVSLGPAEPSMRHSLHSSVDTAIRS